MENKGVNSYIVERISYMGSEFKRLKRYHQIWTMIRAMAFGVAAGLLLGGVLLLLGKMQILQLGKQDIFQVLHFLLCNRILYIQILP